MARKIVRVRRRKNPRRIGEIKVVIRVRRKKRRKRKKRKG